MEMMKILKSAAAAALSLAVAASALPLYTASAMVAENQKYTSSTTIFEDFETLTAEEIQAGNSSVVRGFTNPTTLEKPALASGSGSYLSFAATGDETNDTSMLTKTGLFRYDVTVADVYLRSSVPDASNLSRAVVSLREGNSSQALIDFVYDNNAAKLRNRLDTSKFIAYTNAEMWMPVRFILDRPNKTITVSVAGSSTFTASTTLTWEPSASVYLQFQSLKGNILGIDDITISDGFYLENDYINEDFEHVRNTTSQYVTVTGLTRAAGQATFQGIHDSETNNTYLSAGMTGTGGVPVYTDPNTGIRPSVETPAIISLKLKTDATSNLTVGPRINTGGIYVSVIKIVNGFVSVDNGASGSAVSPYNVSDGAFHTYQIVVSPQSTGGFSASLTVDGVYLDYRFNTNTITGGARLDFRDVAQNKTVDIDDLHIFYPEPAKLRCVSENGNTNIDIDGTFTFESNNPINYRTLTTAAFTLTETGKTNTVQIGNVSNTGDNTFSLAFAEDLKPNTAYTLSVADNALRDLYEQYYSGEIATFTTGDEPASPKYNLTYTMNGEDASGTDCLAAGTLEVTLNVKAYSAGANAFAIAALYDESDRLIKAKTLSSVLDGSGSNTQTTSLTIGEDELAGATAKLFLWNGATFAPIREVTVLTPAANNDTMRT